MSLSFCTFLCSLHTLLPVLVLVLNRCHEKKNALIFANELKKRLLRSRKKGLSKVYICKPRVYTKVMRTWWDKIVGSSWRFMFIKHNSFLAGIEFLLGFLKTIFLRLFYLSPPPFFTYIRYMCDCMCVRERERMLFFPILISWHLHTRRHTQQR